MLMSCFVNMGRKWIAILLALVMQGAFVLAIIPSAQSSSVGVEYVAQEEQEACPSDVVWTVSCCVQYFNSIVLGDDNDKHCPGTALEIDPRVEDLLRDLRSP